MPKIERKGNKQKCTGCEKWMSRDLFQPYSCNGMTIGGWCPICVCDDRNELHGLPPGTPFGGEIAEDMRQRALAEASDGPG